MAATIFDISRRVGLHPKAVLAKAKELGITQAKVVSSLLDDNNTLRLENELIRVASQQMNPNLQNRRVVEVQAGLTWHAALKHRVYSCPNIPAHDSVLGATALLLHSKATGRRVPLTIEAVHECDIRAPNLLNAVPEMLRARLSGYRSEVQNTPGMLDGDCNYRFYFLSSEPWPDEMQELTTPDSTPPTEWSAIVSILSNPDQFFQWPQLGALLWSGCVRTQNDGEHNYPTELATRLARLELKPDDRTNGPAIVSFLAAGGKRPNWGNEGWPIHHIYDGTGGSPHAVSDGNLFTHSAGLVAAHPVAHYLAHQSELLKRLLWREAFLRFGFDPMRVFIES